MRWEWDRVESVKEREENEWEWVEERGGGRGSLRIEKARVKKKWVKKLRERKQEKSWE